MLSCCRRLVQAGGNTWASRECLLEHVRLSPWSHGCKRFYPGCACAALAALCAATAPQVRHVAALTQPLPALVSCTAQTAPEAGSCLRIPVLSVSMRVLR